MGLQNYVMLFWFLPVVWNNRPEKKKKNYIFIYALRQFVLK